MEPLEYQMQAIGVIVSSLHEKNRALAIMATGLGKTIVAASTLKSLKRGKQHLRNLVVCHDTDILEQSESTFRAILGKSADIGYFTGESKDGPGAEIVFSTFQILREWKEAFFRDEFDLLTVDEAHHSQALTYKEVIEYFSGAKLLGLTAMRDRMDGKDIAEIFGEPVVDIPLEEAIARGLLTSFEYRVVSDGLNTEAVRVLTREVEGGKRFTLSDVNKRLFIETRDEEIIRRIQREAKSRKTLVFCRNIRHADRIAEMLGPRAQAYHSDSTRSVNKVILSSFRRGDIQYLVAINKANEGVDIPDAEVVVFLRTTDSKTVFFEQLGRSLRKLPWKKKALLLDFVGNLDRILMLQDIIRKVGEYRGLREYEEKKLIHVSGKDFEFNFSERIVEVFDLLTRIRKNLYSSWEEAADAAIKLGVTTPNQYNGRYKMDPRLPSAPWDKYPNFPGWRVFFGREKSYATWEEASEAIGRLGISTPDEYKSKYREDPHLPSSPWSKYPDFPGWLRFVGKRPRDHYPTWQEASQAARRLGIKSRKEYRQRHKEDPRLPSGEPQQKYKGCPGWPVFLKTNTAVPRTNFYPTWQEAAVAARRLGITSTRKYKEGYKKDPLLPARPRDIYSDFPGSIVFFGQMKQRRT